MDTPLHPHVRGCCHAVEAGGAAPDPWMPTEGSRSSDGDTYGIFHGMKATIDRLGRVVVPKPIRDRLQLHGGETLEVEERDGVINLRPAPTEVELVQTPEGPVARPLDHLPPLTDATVRDTLEQVRR